MIASQVKLAPDASPATELPALQPRLVAASSEVERLVQSARASIAMDGLELRSALHEAEAAEAAAADRDGTVIELTDTHAYVLAALEQVTRRRAELAAEIDGARAEAAALVAAAHAEAGALVAAAVRERVDRAAASAPARADLLAADVAGIPAAPSATPVHEDVIDLRDEVAAAAVPPAALPPPPFSTTLVPPRPWLVAEALSTPAPPVAPGPRSVGGTRAPASGLRGLLFADVLLPLLAAVAVLVILLAWLA